MSKYYEGLTRPERVREVYSTSTNLDAKYEVIREFGIAAETFSAWLLRRLSLTGSEHVLDVGCGQGRFLVPIARQATTGLVVGLDISPGVMSALGETIREEPLRAVLVVGDAQALPFLDESFDLVMANHMLCGHPCGRARGGARTPQRRDPRGDDERPRRHGSDARPPRGDHGRARHRVRPSRRHTLRPRERRRHPRVRVLRDRRVAVRRRLPLAEQPSR